MSLRVITRDGEVAVDDDALATRVRDAASVGVDVGTGDGRYALAWARRAPTALVIGIDPAAERLRETARRASKTTAKGGAPNLVLLRGTVEAPAAALVGVADDVHVVLPWGRLLVGVVDAEPEVVAGLVTLGHAGSRYRIVLNAAAWADPPKSLETVAPPTIDHLDAVTVPAFAAHGLTLTVRRLDAADAAAVPSTWAGRLAHAGRTPDFLELTGTLDLPTSLDLT